MCLLLIRQREVIEGDGMEGATLTRIYGKLFFVVNFSEVEWNSWIGIGIIVE